MKKFMAEFKKFAFKGNVLDMAVGVMIATAFNKIVSSLVNDIAMPVLSLITGGVSVDCSLHWVKANSKPLPLLRKPAWLR